MVDCPYCGSRRAVDLDPEVEYSEWTCGTVQLGGAKRTARCRELESKATIADRDAEIKRLRDAIEEAYEIGTKAPELKQDAENATKENALLLDEAVNEMCCVLDKELK